MMTRRLILPAIIVLLLLAGCVYDNEKDLFPRVVVPDTAIQGQLAWYSFDSTLADQLGYQDPLRLWGKLEFGMDYTGVPFGAVVLDGLKDYLGGFLSLSDTLAVSLWILPMPNYPKAVLLDYGMGRFTAGLDAITSATWPRFRLYYEQDTTIHYWSQEIDYFFWHHIYMEIGDTLVPPRVYIDGYPAEPAEQLWKMHPLVGLLYIGRHFNTDLKDTMLFRGYIDDLRIYNQLLTEEEILNLYWGGGALR
ncbi:MAG: LamG-like jellyroll fold domain-containing protein [Bacteroidales bacterium]